MSYWTQENASRSSLRQSHRYIVCDVINVIWDARLSFFLLTKYPYLRLGHRYPSLSGYHDLLQALQTLPVQLQTRAQRPLTFRLLRDDRGIQVAHHLSKV